MRKEETIYINENFSDDDFITVAKLTLSTVKKARDYLEYEETIDIYTMKMKRIETTYFFKLYRYVKSNRLITSFDIFYITKEFSILNYSNIESNVIAEVLEKKLGFKQAFS